MSCTVYVSVCSFGGASFFDRLILYLTQDFSTQFELDEVCKTLLHVYNMIKAPTFTLISRFAKRFYT